MRLYHIFGLLFSTSAFVNNPQVKNNTDRPRASCPVPSHFDDRGYFFVFIAFLLRLAEKSGDHIRETGVQLHGLNGIGYSLRGINTDG